MTCKFLITKKVREVWLHGGRLVTAVFIVQFDIETFEIPSIEDIEDEVRPNVNG